MSSKLEMSPRGMNQRIGSGPGVGGAWGLSHGLVASLVAQMIKNPPSMQETQAQSLDWEDPLEKGMATLSSILA